LAAARLAARAAEDKKARDIHLLDARPASSLAYFFVVATVDSALQMQAVGEAVDAGVKAEIGLGVLRFEGRGATPWRVLDYGGFVVHLFTEASRAFYGLERLWEGAKPLAWGKSAPPRRRAARAAKKSVPRLIQ